MAEGAVQVAKQTIDLSIWCVVVHSTPDKLCIDLILDFDMFLYCIPYCSHQTQVRRQARLAGRWQTSRIQPTISSVMTPSHTRNVTYTMRSHIKRLLDLVAV